MRELEGTHGNLRDLRVTQDHIGEVSGGPGLCGSALLARGTTSSDLLLCGVKSTNVTNQILVLTKTPFVPFIARDVDGLLSYCHYIGELAAHTIQINLG